MRWKKPLAKDARLSLPLTEVMMIARPTSPLLDAPHQSSPRSRLRHGRRRALLFHPNQTLNLCTHFFAMSLALLPRLPPLLISSTFFSQGISIGLRRLPEIPLFRFSAKGLGVAEPDATSLSSAEPSALWSLTRLFALLSLPLNFLWLPPTSPRPLPLAQTKLPIPC